MVLLTLIDDRNLSKDDVKSHSIWNLFYHMLISNSDLVTLQEHAGKLLIASETLQTWLESSYGDYLQFTNEATLAELRHYWSQYVSVDVSPKSKIDVSVRNGMSKRVKEIGTSTFAHGLRSAGFLWLSGLEVLSHTYRSYWKTGVAGGNTADCTKLGQKSHVNPMFAASSSPLGEFAVHYGSDPLLGFHLTETFRRLYHCGEKDSLAAQSDRLVEAAKTQFTDWCHAFSALVRSRRACVQLFSGEAVALCHQLQLGIGDASFYTKPWKLQPLRLDGHAGQIASRWPFSDRFDVIDTSNLGDHVGLINMIVATAPLLRTQATSVLCTESLLAASDDPTSSLSAVLGTDIVTFSLFIGLAPTGLLAGTTLEAVSNEAGLRSISSPVGIQQQSQYRLRIHWKSPYVQSSPAWLVSSDKEKTLKQVSVDADGLAAWLFSIYKKMFAKEDLSTLFSGLQSMQNKHYFTDMQRYTRAAVVALIRVLKTTVLTGWDRVMTTFLDMVESDRTLLVGSNSLQELNMHLALFGVWTLPVLAQGPRRIQKTFNLQLRPRSDVEGVLGRPDPPPIVYIILSVPRKSLEVFTSGPGKISSTPGIHVSVKQQSGDQQYENCFHSFHCYFGRAFQGGDDGGPDQFEEDDKGWLGSSDLVIMCPVPTFSLLTGPRSSLRICLALNTTPENMGLYTQKLGPLLTVFETAMDNRRRVSICEYPAFMNTKSSIASQQKWLQLHTIRTEAMTTATAMLDANHRAKKLAIRVVFIQGSEEAKALASGTSVSVAPASSSMVILQLGDAWSRRLVFPFPVQPSNSKTRIARKSCWIEVEAPIYVANQPDSFDMWTLVHSQPDGSLSLGSIPRVNLDVQPPISSTTKKDQSWLSLLMGGTLSETEKYLKDHDHDLSTHPKIDLKDSLNIIIQSVAGVHPKEAKGRPVQIFQLTLSRNQSCHTLIFVSGLHHDLDLGSVVLDAWVLPLTIERVQKLANGLQGLLSAKPPPVGVLLSGRESTLWKRLLPALAERCRTWNHKASCEYRTEGQIPLSTDEDQSPLCSCGEGKVTSSFTKVKQWAPFAQYVTRVAIAPVFPVPYMESLMRFPDPNVSTAPEPKVSTGRTLQKPECDNCKASSGQLLACGGCNKVRYCSKECQKAAWKAHKVRCKK